MRTKLPALLAVLAAGLWVAAGAVSWDRAGLSDTSEMLWWAGLGVFALASAFTGYASVTDSPLWLKAVVFVGAGALGGSVLSAFDTATKNAYLFVGAAGWSCSCLPCCCWR
ncbi:MAG: hypothetical protein HZY75_03645 [Nocardioidaceae bacterium]|nr:MAG: hypothetical protein HZY75_03645 [Nocardioidaceae bacterium]